MIINTNDGRGLIPVSEGGTGASTAEEALKELGGISIKKVWKNANNKNNSPSQKIPMDLSDYKMVAAIFKFSTGTEIYKGALFPVGYDGKMDLIHASNGSLYGLYRSCKPTTDGVTLGTGWYTNHNTDAANDAYLILDEIYGVKGVQ